MEKEVGRVPPPGGRQALPVGVSSRAAQKAPSRKRRGGAAADQEEARRAEEQQQKKRRADDEARAARRGDAREDRVPTATETNEVLTTSGDIGSSISGSSTGVGLLEERPDRAAEGRYTVPTVSGVAQDNEQRAGGAAGALRGRGPTREEPTASPLLHTATRGAVVERARRRTRNRAGRYELQYQVEFVTRPGVTTTEWLSAGAFEKLFDQGKIEDALLAGDGVWTERALTDDGARVVRAETDDGDD
ncbi:unnamed protein product [Phytophthora fragariaefolia]|uniref:Unnamed protein product n=1 Tax=Phytophthora fragariaefolia TaxID=1490495 RepID=A0A9W6YHE7_9STRA|nr:unnamed protein product [Phytophthora fragariaefolia]